MSWSKLSFLGKVLIHYNVQTLWKVRWLPRRDWLSLLAKETNWTPRSFRVCVCIFHMRSWKQIFSQFYIKYAKSHGSFIRENIYAASFGHPYIILRIVSLWLSLKVLAL